MCTCGESKPKSVHNFRSDLSLPESSTNACGASLRFFHRTRGQKSPQRQILGLATNKTSPKAEFSRIEPTFPPEFHRKSRVRPQPTNLSSVQIRLVRQGYFHFPQYPPPIRILLLVFLCILMYRISLSYARAREAAAHRRLPAGQGMSLLWKSPDTTSQQQSRNSFIHKPYRRHIYCNYPRYHHRYERERRFPLPYNREPLKPLCIIIPIE